MSNYFVNFANTTNDTWTLAVYQTLPYSVGLDSVSWKQTTVPRSGASSVEWDLTYNVALANYEQEGGIGVYSASQTLSAELGTTWQCVWEDGVQQLVQLNSSAPGNTIIIDNVSNQLANLGIGMSGEGSVYKNNVVSGGAAQFTVTPTYYFGLFNQVVLGEVISSNVIVGPTEIQFPNGMNQANVTALMSGATIVVDVAYSQVSFMQTDMIDHKLASLPKRSSRLLERSK